jgi:hypothetical protein
MDPSTDKFYNLLEDSPDVLHEKWDIVSSNLRTKHLLIKGFTSQQSKAIFDTAMNNPYGFSLANNGVEETQFARFILAKETLNPSS